MIFIHKYSTGGTYMFNKIKEFFTGKPVEVVAEVPYKLETPVVSPVVESIAPAKKVPAKKVPAAKKPRAPKAVK
jgi:hypothetical protein